uniref:Small ribosomal subunit protein uS5c n=1 Tax=Hildenbrandia rivularis TaxID=135206 RepID=A0A1C9CFQ2_9FLOR|nr:ribosomal protein S5 [Hildenbrandia rivularis]AOM67228.1 ribosomal protein S5 [Hildenbrandia rivularis]
MNNKKRDKKTENNWQEKVVQVNRVTKVVKGGKKMSFRAILVVGNEQGCVGVGIGKASNVINAVKKGVADAKKNLVILPVTKTNSIPHSTQGIAGAAKIIMQPSYQGSGVIAGGATRTVLELAGIKNVVAKQLRSNNILNNARATINALNSLTTLKQVAKNRDIDTEKLYTVTK